MNASNVIEMERGGYDETQSVMEKSNGAYLCSCMCGNYAGRLRQF